MVARVLFAAGFTVIGIGGLILPILPGWIFLIVAVMVLFPMSRFATSAFDRLEKRMPRTGRLVRRVIVGKRTLRIDPRISPRRHSCRIHPDVHGER